MCTNPYDLLYINNFDISHVEELSNENNFVEIIYKSNQKWFRDCYDKKQLITNGLTMFSDKNTFWNEGNANNRVKSLHMLPLANQLITEDSFRLFYLDIKSFLLIEGDEHSLGSYFGVSRWHGMDKQVYKLVPLQEITEAEYNDMENISTNVFNINEDETCKSQVCKFRADLSKIPEDVDVPNGTEIKHYKTIRTINFVTKNFPANHEDGYNRATIPYKYSYTVNINMYSYSETYNFTETKTLDQIAFNMSTSRVEERKLKNCSSELFVDLSKNICGMYIDINSVNTQYTAKFLLKSNNQDYTVSIEDDTLYENEEKNIINFTKEFLGSPVNQFTKEQYIRLAAVLWVIQNPYIDFENDDYKTLLELLVMGMPIKQEMTHYNSYFLDSDQTITFLKNINIMEILGKFDEEFAITKNIFLLEYLDLVDFDSIYKVENLDIDEIYKVEDNTVTTLYDNNIALNQNTICNFFSRENTPTARTSRENYTAMHKIIQNNKLTNKQKKILLYIMVKDYGMSFNIRDPENLLTTMMKNRISNMFDFAGYLIKNGSYVEQNNYFLPNIHQALLKGDRNYDLVKLFIDNGSDLSKEINFDKYILVNVTPLEMAQYFYDNTSQRCIKLLREKSNLSVRNRYYTHSEFRSITTSVRDVSNNNIMELNIQAPKDSPYNLTDMIIEADTEQEFNYINYEINRRGSNRIRDVEDNGENVMTALLSSHLAKDNNFNNQFKQIYLTIINNRFPINEPYKNFRPIEMAINTLDVDKVLCMFDISSNIDVNLPIIFSNEIKTLMNFCTLRGNIFLPVVQKLIEIGYNIRNSDYLFAKNFNKLNNNASTLIYSYLLKAKKDYSFIEKIIKIKNNGSSKLPLEFQRLKYINKLFFTGIYNFPQAVLNVLHRNMISESTPNLLPLLNKRESEYENFNFFKQVTKDYIDNGGDINYCDFLNRTLLWNAVVFWLPIHVIKYLIQDLGADVNSVDKHGLSILDVAYSKGKAYEDVISLLELYNARTQYDEPSRKRLRRN